MFVQRPNNTSWSAVPHSGWHSPVPLPLSSLSAMSYPIDSAAGPSTSKRRASPSSDLEGQASKRAKFTDSATDAVVHIGDASRTPTGGSVPHAMDRDHDLFDRVVQSVPFYDQYRQCNMLALLLRDIVDGVEGLNQDYNQKAKAQSLLEAHEDLRSILEECMQDGKYERVRVHPALQIEHPAPGSPSSSQASSHTSHVSAQPPRPLGDNIFEALAEVRRTFEDQLRRTAHEDHHQMTNPDETHSQYYFLQDILGAMIEEDPDLRQWAHAVFNRRKHMLVFDTTGSGKTKSLAEAMLLFLSIFLAASENPNIGSEAFHTVLKWVGQTPGFVSELPNESTARARISKSNKNIAETKITLAPLAYYICLGWLIEFSDGVAPRDLRRRWTFLQLFPRTVMDDGSDIFVSIVNERKFMDNDQITNTFSDIRSKIKAKFGDDFVYIVLDEAQAAVAHYPNAFCSQDGGRCSALQPTLSALASPSCFPQSLIILAGTGLDLGLVKKSVESSAGKMRQNWMVYPTIGSFDDKERQQTYIMKKVWPDRTIESLDERELKILERAYHWLQGRCRWTALYVSLLQRFGTGCAHGTLDRLVTQITAGYIPTDGTFYSEQEPDIMEIDGLEPQIEAFPALQFRKLSHYPALEMQIHRILMCYAVRAQPYILKEKFHQSVALGFGRTMDYNRGIPLERILREGSSSGGDLAVVVNEPIVRAAAFIYFEKQTDELTITDFVTNPLRSHLAAPGPRGYFMEDAVAVGFLRAIHDQKSLSDILNFHGDDSVKDLDFLQKPVTLMSITGRGSRGKFRTAASHFHQGASPGIGFEAKSPKDIEKFCNGQVKTIFLYPDINAGPDVACLAFAAQQFFWLFLQIKSILRRRLGPAETSDALRSTNPEYIYLNSTGEEFSPKKHPGLPKHIREVMKVAVPTGTAAPSEHCLPVVRVLVSFPADPDIKKIEEDANREGYITATFDDLVKDGAYTKILRCLRDKVV